MQNGMAVIVAKLTFVSSPIVQVKYKMLSHSRTSPSICQPDFIALSLLRIENRVAICPHSDVKPTTGSRLSKGALSKKVKLLFVMKGNQRISIKKKNTIPCPKPATMNA